MITEIEKMPITNSNYPFATKRAFDYWNTQLHDWHVETGDFEIMMAKSSSDIVYAKKIKVESTVKLPLIYTMDSTIGDVMEDPQGKQLWMK